MVQASRSTLDESCISSPRGQKFYIPSHSQFNSLVYPLSHSIFIYTAYIYAVSLSIPLERLYFRAHYERGWI